MAPAPVVLCAQAVALALRPTKRWLPTVVRVLMATLVVPVLEPEASRPAIKMGLVVEEIS